MISPGELTLKPTKARFSSYVIGYSGGFEGPKVSWPKMSHHRGSSCPTDFSVPCGEDYAQMSKNPNPNVNILFVSHQICRQICHPRKMKVKPSL